MQNRIQFQFAKTVNDEIINISEANKSIHYYCLGCSQKVIPIQGGKNKHHYRHYHSDCNKESYYHIAGKLAFESVWKRRIKTFSPLPLTLQRKVQCNNPTCISLLDVEHTCSTLQDARFDLTRLFTDYAVEQRDSTTNLIPDILLFNTQGHKCYIEICNTHACSQDKLRSGIPIIEISSRDDEDIQYILDGNFKHDDFNLAIYNFKVANGFSSTFNKCNSDHEINVVHIASDFRLKSSKYTMKDLVKNNHANSLLFLSELPPATQLTKIQGFLISKGRDPVGYRNCFICDHVRTWSNGQVFCNHSNRNVLDDTGAMCSHFKVKM